ncbi:uncharacterized protein LOC131010698 [Salvia miltiorrhiza]|uniref:uncharacterized protein LOC131010698 n=1 Tax=Salvia miltiorrhiza TaxID=226208 RepID=UPI0025ABF2EB|nr:uncharacterized protein LOC131010698 [Salvia miltiorrhiza]
MKLLSFNVRGLGSNVKKREIREIVRKMEIDVCFVQETKREILGLWELKMIWGGEDFGYAEQSAEGRSGGILTIWNEKKFVASSHWEIPGALIVNGFCRIGNLACCLVNVYAAQNPSEKEILWDTIGMMLGQNREACVCVAGDFNAIRAAEERSGRGLQFSPREMRVFDNFITGNALEDIRLQGRGFTWYQPQGLCKTKLDRFLVNDKWLPHLGALKSKRITKIGVGSLPNSTGY